jgi:flagellar hook protein FlgE
MNQAFYTGITGMQSYQFGLDVLSDNLANISTVGFRGDNVEFASIYDGALSATMFSGSTSDGIGEGSRVQATAMDQHSGSIMSSDSVTDFAIGGDGWFGVQGGSDEMYTRSGIFTFDGDRNLVSYDGMYLLGTMGTNIGADDVLNEVISTTPLAAPSAQGKISLPNTLTVSPEPSTYVNFWGNLRSDEELIHQSSVVIAPNGDDNFLTLEYTKSAQQPDEGISWDITATLRSKLTDEVYDVQEGSALFDVKGAIVSFDVPVMDNGGQALTVSLGEDFAGVTSIDNLAVSNGSEYDGRKEGTLVGYDVNINGEIIAAFDNGVSSSVGRVAIFHFNNEQGLERVSGTHFKQSSNSGEAIFYKNENGEYILGADLRNFSLESSNMQFEQGLTELIIIQRSLDANAKSITTGDELIQKALQMDA